MVAAFRLVLALLTSSDIHSSRLVTNANCLPLALNIYYRLPLTYPQILTKNISNYKVHVQNVAKHSWHLASLAKTLLVGSPNLWQL